LEKVLDVRSLDEARSYNLARQSAGLAEFDPSRWAAVAVAHVARGRGSLLGDKGEEGQEGSMNQTIVN
jgi:hypothetical protein